VRTKRLVCSGFVAAVLIAGCGSSGPASERTGLASSAIQAGATDTTHLFAVGVVQINSQTIEFCSGTLLAPNLVATARHCVAQISSPQIDCAHATFGSLVPESSLYVTTDALISQHSGFVPVAVGGIIVPPATPVCGNDIALLVLSQDINLPGGYPKGYVVPAITPPLTDPSRSTTVTAIGYGVNTPTDDAGTTAGTRRIKQNVGLACIPNDLNFIDCFSDPTARQVLTAAEFVSGDMSTCEGDSGSGAYDQAAFDAGSWVSFGVLSRGSTSSDGLSCVQPIYTRFDAWGPLLVQAAQQAFAAAGGKYALPSWAGATPDGGASQGSADGGADAARGDDGAAGTSATVVAADGTPCDTPNVACQSHSCVAFDGVHYYCASECDDAGSCPGHFVCKGNTGGQPGYCFPESNVPGAGGSASGGCSAGTGRVGPPGAAGVSWLFVGLGALGVPGARRLRRRKGRLSGS
jgi:hypothetical protein